MTHRIVSLIASSTETICALGFEDQLVGRSHECDYPPSVRHLPSCSEPKFNTEGTSREIDNRVKEVLKEALSVYRVDVEVLKKLDPTVIITQDQCEVCAVSLKDVEKAVCELLPSNPQVVSLAPNSLDDIFDGIKVIATALGALKRGKTLSISLQRRMKKIESTALNAGRKPTVVCVEWIDPLMTTGNWMPKLVEMAGGNDLLGKKDQHAPRIRFEDISEKDPDYLILLPCGWDISKTRAEMKPLINHPQWHALRAVKECHVFLTDGNQYFNRPGPRVVESLEIITEILHPELFRFKHQYKGWESFYNTREE